MKFPLYLIRNYLAIFLIVLGCSLLVYLVLDFVGQIELWLAKPWKDAQRYYLYYTPQILYLVMPIAVLLTNVVAIGGLARHLELAAMKAAGVSAARMLFPVVVFNLAISGGMFWLAESVLPDANHKRLEIAQPKTRNAEKNRRDKDRYDFVFVGMAGGEYVMRHYNAVDSSAENVILFQVVGDTIAKRWDAKRLEWRKGRWQLLDGQERILVSADSVRWRPFDTLKLDSRVFAERPEDLLDTRFKADEMQLRHIEHKIEVLRRAGDDTREMETQWHSRFSTALTCFFVGLFGIALSHRVLRGGIAKGVGFGLLFAVAYYLSIRFGLILGSNGAVPPWLGAWLPNLGLGTLAVISYLRSLR